MIQFFVGYFFSEMTYQKWIVLIAFLTLFSFLPEVKSYPTCLEEVVQQLQETLTTVGNLTYGGKSPNCPVKVKRKRDEQVYYNVFCCCCFLFFFFCIKRMSLF